MSSENIELHNMTLKYQAAVNMCVKLNFKIAELESKMKIKDEAILKMAHDLELLEARVMVPRKK